MATESSGWSQGGDSTSPSSRDNYADSDSFLATASSKVVAIVLSVFTPKQGKLREEFNKPGRPSSPKNIEGAMVDMEIADVEKRMNELGFLVSMLSEDKYGKLCWIIGKGLDKIALRNKGYLHGRLVLHQILSTNKAMGKRFDSIYRSDRDNTTGPEGLLCPVEFMKEKLGVDTSSENTYTIYSDPNHKNVEYFSREQTWGNCHMQGPILLHWILSLWHDKDKKAGDVRMIHMSKYLRNAISNNELYDYIVEERGGSSFARAAKIMPEAFGCGIHVTNAAWKYEQFVERLKNEGPALVEMNELYTDFLEKNKVVYAGSPPKESERLESGHGMLLIGVFKDTGIHSEASNEKTQQTFQQEDILGTPLTQVHLLLQNWWPEKPIIKVRLDYFNQCQGCLRFGNGEKVKEVNHYSYSTKTCGVRRAVTAPPMDKGIIHRGVKSLDSSRCK